MVGILNDANFFGQGFNGLINAFMANLLRMKNIS